MARINITEDNEVMVDDLASTTGKVCHVCSCDKFVMGQKFCTFGHKIIYSYEFNYPIFNYKKININSTFRSNIAMKELKEQIIEEYNRDKKISDKSIVQLVTKLLSAIGGGIFGNEDKK